MARLKRISEEERAARAMLKKMGVSEYELERLYDANYKARKRAEAGGAEYGGALNLNWKNILRGAYQAKRQGKSASEYVRARAKGFGQRYRASEVKKEILNDLIQNPDDWAQEILNKKLKQLSAAELSRIRNEAIEQMIENGEISKDIVDETYRATKRKYEETNASTQAEWDEYLAEARAQYVEDFEIMTDYIARYLGIDLYEIQKAQKIAEAQAEKIGNEQARAKFLENAKREAFSMFGGV